MIKLIGDNNICECIRLMDTSLKKLEHQLYDRNERCWLQHIAHHVEEQNKGNALFLAIGDYASDNSLRGFMLASAFKNFYNHNWVMDVKECITDNNYNNAFTVARMFNYMINHVKEQGGSYWRADTIRAGTEANNYIQFLIKKYNAIPFQGVHGKV